MARCASEQPRPGPADELAVLRTQWKWAAFSQFFTTFSPLLHAPDVTVTDIENDLVNGSNKVIARIMQRLLYTLSYDRKISLGNWQSALRKQYMKRNPLLNPLGSEPPREAVESREGSPEDQDTKQVPSETLLSENDSATTPQAGLSASRAPTHEPEDKTRVIEDQAPVDWFQLPMLAKLDSLHLVTEWQFQNPTRLRTLMRNDDELAIWRHEPIGYDSKKNSFWLIGGDRLWIQRVLPKPQKSRKRKRLAESQKVHQAFQKVKPPKRPCTQTTITKLDAPPRRLGSGRAAKIQAKIRLDAQVKELAEFNLRVNGNRSTTRLSKRSKLPSRTLGTRVSARLRGSQTSEWQVIPDEWLDQPSGIERETNLADPVDQNCSRGDLHQSFSSQDDSDSELTELSDDSDNRESSGLSDEQVHATATEDANPPVKEEESENQVGDEFIEWETICVTLEEWEHIAERFENATHYLEKALYKFLTNDIVPEITETLRELERKKRIETALVHRKRSSRIALRESEKEEARLAARRQAEEKEKMSRSRRLELRKQREEEERLRREQGREQRRKEREVRELRKQAELEEHENQSSDRQQEAKASTAPEPSNSRTIPSKAGILKRRTRPSMGNTSYKGVKSSDWELDCEICRKRGINLEDESPMMSCGKCLKWQHITCHDQADERAGRAKRNWDVVEFVCQQCRSRMFSAPEALSSSNQDHHHHFVNRQNANHVPSHHHSAVYHPYFTQGYTTSQVSPPPPQSSAISTLYHAANGRYNYTQPYGDVRTPGIPDRYLSSGQPYIPTHLHNHQPPSISFSHYQPQGGGFSSNGKAQRPYSENYDQRHQTSQHASYSDIRSSANQRSTVGSPTQIVWNISTPVAGSYTTPYQSAACSNGQSPII